MIVLNSFIVSFARLVYGQWIADLLDGRTKCALSNTRHRQGFTCICVWPAFLNSAVFQLVTKKSWDYFYYKKEDQVLTGWHNSRVFCCLSNRKVTILLQYLRAIYLKPDWTKQFINQRNWILFLRRLVMFCLQQCWLNNIVFMLFKQDN